VKWLILAVFLAGMLSAVQWYEAVTRERKMAFGLMTGAAFLLVLVLGNTIL
jgi:nitrate reductase gamma subunit